jgi:hypothetical protein
MQTSTLSWSRGITFSPPSGIYYGHGRKGLFFFAIGVKILVGAVVYIFHGQLVMVANEGSSLAFIESSRLNIFLANIDQLLASGNICLNLASPIVRSKED